MNLIKNMRCIKAGDYKRYDFGGLLVPSFATVKRTGTDTNSYPNLTRYQIDLHIATEFYSIEDSTVELTFLETLAKRELLRNVYSDLRPHVAELTQALLNQDGDKAMRIAETINRMVHGDVNDI